MSRADDLRQLHLDPAILVLVNAWDAASARTVAAAPGCRAIATASWSVAAAHGYPDGEAIPRALALEAVRVVAAAVDLPVTADLERGYDDPGETTRLAVAAGAAGGNVEDGLAEGGLRAFEDSVERIAAVRAADAGFVINARTDEFLRGGKTVEEAVRRGCAYLEAGADCVFVPGVRDAETIRALVDGMGGPVSVLAGPGSPSVRELEELGVARVSIGPGGMGVAMAALQRAAAELLGGGAPLDDLAFRPPQA
ncbi:MAG: isocitrate lyase/phosphoenolpyruvate mutase family protein [Solirubrobacterales bacterium]|nr:isocitrate lyase/phosphoenolpyruvate mutase family protein [Solirubrobacterales bacterium]